MRAPGLIHTWQVGALIKAEGRGGQQMEQIGFAWSKTLHLDKTLPRKGVCVSTHGGRKQDHLLWFPSGHQSCYSAGRGQWCDSLGSLLGIRAFGGGSEALGAASLMEHQGVNRTPYTGQAGPSAGFSLHLPHLPGSAGNLWPSLPILAARSGLQTFKDALDVCGSFPHPGFGIRRTWSSSLSNISSDGTSAGLPAFKHSRGRRL